MKKTRFSKVILVQNHIALPQFKLGISQCTTLYPERRVHMHTHIHIPTLDYEYYTDDYRVEFSMRKNYKHPPYQPEFLGMKDPQIPFLLSFLLNKSTFECLNAFGSGKHS